MAEDAALRKLTAVDRADVHKAGRVVARVDRHVDRTVMTYVADDVAPVGLAYPVREQPYVSPAGSVPAVLANLLPEGRRLTALRRAVRTSADDEVSLLLAVGGDLVGDLQFTPEGEPPVVVAPVVDDPSAVRFAEIAGVADVGPIDRRGLAGVQAKVSSVLVSLPVTDVAAGGRPAILKLDVPEFPHLVRNELVMYEVARRAGLDVPEAREVHDVDGRPGLLVARFDRGDGRDPPRFPQEDGCQVLARWPADKYRLDVETVVGALAAHGVPSPLVALDLLRQVAFAALTGNGDQHAKNLSILRDGPRWRASPAYDLPTTHPYGDASLGLPIGGRTGDPPRRRFVAAGEQLGVRPRAVERMLDALVATVEDWLDLLDELPFDERRRRRLRAFVHNRATLLAGGT